MTDQPDNASRKHSRRDWDAALAEMEAGADPPIDLPDWRPWRAWLLQGWQATVEEADAAAEAAAPPVAGALALRRPPWRRLIARFVAHSLTIAVGALIGLFWITGGAPWAAAPAGTVAAVMALATFPAAAAVLLAQLWWEYRCPDSRPWRWWIAAPLAGIALDGAVLLVLLGAGGFGGLVLVGVLGAALVLLLAALGRTVTARDFKTRCSMAVIGLLAAVIAFYAPLAVLVVGAGFLGLKALQAWEPPSPSAKAHRPDLLAAPEVRAAVARASRPGGVFAGRIEEGDVYTGPQDRGCVIGPPGTGKTAFLISQLLDWADSGRSFVVNDIKPEIYAIVKDRLEAKGYRLRRFNPTDKSGDRYNPLADLESVEAVGELAAALVPSDNAEDAVFHESARDLLDAVLCHLRESAGAASLPGVRDYVGKMPDHRELLGDLAESPSADAREIARGLTLMAGNERLLGSIFATFQAHLRFLRFPTIREALRESDFSLADLGGSRVGLFLQFEETQQQTTARLFSVMMGHVLRTLMERPRRAPVLLLLDEIGNAPPVAGLTQKLNTIRARNLPTWLFFQSREQMQCYGTQADEGANILMGACDLHMVFRLNDNATAEWVSAKIGTVDRLTESVSISDPGQVFSPAQRTHTHALQREPVVFPHALQQLAPGETVSTYRGLAWRGAATPYFERWPEFQEEAV